MTSFGVVGAFQPYGTRSIPLAIPTSENPNPSTALCLVSSILPSEISAARFYIVSHDQGSSETSHDGPWSWFEVSIVRPFQPELNPAFPDLNEIKASPEEFGKIIQESGFYFADLPGGKSENADLDLTSLFLTSNTSASDWENHFITWSRDKKDGDGHEFLSLLEEGDRIVVWARAQV